MPLIDGDGLNNTLNGGAGNDTINGYSGNDTISGGDGADLINGGDGDDVIDGGPGTDRATYINAISAVVVNLATGVATGGDGTDSLTSIEQVTGSMFSDTLTGDAQNNNFRGRGGNDTIDGGAGVDTASYAEAASGVVVSLVTGLASNDGDVGVDTLINIENLSGSAFADSLTGNAGDNLLIGNGGNDTLDGGAGIDTADYSFDTAGVSVNLALGAATDGYGSTDTLSNIEYVLGTAFNDNLVGNSLDNRFNPGAGNDTVDGGAGVADMVRYTGATAAVNVNLVNGIANDGMGGTDTLISIERVEGSAFNDVITGNSQNNQFRPRAGDDTIDGGGGFDRLAYFGPAGINVLFTSASAGTVSDGYGGTDTFTNIEGIFTSEFNDTITGAAGSQSFLDYGGADIYDGGADFDDLSYDASLTAININGNSITGGTGPLGVAGTDTLSNIELVYASNFNDTILGTSGNDQYAGMIGNDTIDGAGGFDFAVYSNYNTTTGIVADLNTGVVSDGAGGTDLLINIEAIWGSNFNDVVNGNNIANSLFGNSGNDTIQGEDGNDFISGGFNNDRLLGGEGDDTVNGDDGDDLLFGGNGNDTINGGTGNDTLIYDASSVGVTVNLGITTAQNTVGEGTDVITGVEGLRGSNFNDTLSGDGFSNFLSGGLGNDTVSYSDATGLWNFVNGVFVPGTGVTVNLALTGAQNTFVAGIDTLQEFENLTGSAFNDTLYGNAAANVIIGGAGNDLIVDDGGNDTIEGGDGDDTAYSYAGADLLSGGAGTDVLVGGDGNDTLSGGAGDDYLYGGGDNDLMNGNDGADWLIGDEGADIGYGGIGNDVLFGYGGADLMNGEDGDDTFLLGAGDDTASGGAGNDWMVADEGNDLLNGGGDIDNLWGLAGNDTLNGDAGNDILIGGEGNDLGFGGDGNDYFYAGADNDTFSGGAGNDVVFGDTGSDDLTGGAGFDYLYGGAGADTYRMNTGDQEGYIYDNDVSSNTDRVVFGQGITKAATQFIQSGSDLLVYYGATDYFYVQYWFVTSQNQLEQFNWADGSSMTNAQVNALFG